MLSDKSIENRCRVRLAHSGFRIHKVLGNLEPVYFIYEDGSDDSAPEDDYRYMTLSELNDYCAEMAEQGE